MDDQYLKVKEFPNFVRDTKSNAILLNDKTSLDKIQKQRQINDIKSDINSLKTEFSEIKFLLSKLLEQQK